MANRKKHTPEAIVKILRDIEIEQGRGASQDAGHNSMLKDVYTLMNIFFFGASTLGVVDTFAFGKCI